MILKNTLILIISFLCIFLGVKSMYANDNMNFVERTNFKLTRMKYNNIIENNKNNTNFINDIKKCYNPVFNSDTLDIEFQNCRDKINLLYNY